MATGIPRPRSRACNVLFPACLLEIECDLRINAITADLIVLDRHGEFLDVRTGHEFLPFWFGFSSGFAALAGAAGSPAIIRTAGFPWQRNL